MDGSQAPEVAVHNAPEHYYQTDPKSAYYSGAQQNESSVLPLKPSKKIIGLHRSTFWLLVILVVVVIAAAVGGGVGGSIAVSNAKKSKASDTSTANDPSNSDSEPSPADNSTTSPTSTGLFTVPTNAKLPLECESNGQEKLVSWYGRKYRFTLTCTSDRESGNVMGIRAFSLGDCCIGCVSYASKYGDGSCTGVVFSESLDEGFANCFLKNGSFAVTKTASGVVAAELR